MFLSLSGVAAESVRNKIPAWHMEIACPLEMWDQILRGFLDFVPELQNAALSFVCEVPWWLWVERGALALDVVCDGLQKMKILRIP